jgi:hypothetical protein
MATYRFFKDGIDYKYITFLFYNTKISDNNAESGKVPQMLAAFPRWMAKEILSKRNFFDKKIAH